MSTQWYYSGWKRVCYRAKTVVGDRARKCIYDPGAGLFTGKPYEVGHRDQ